MFASHFTTVCNLRLAAIIIFVNLRRDLILPNDQAIDSELAKKNIKIESVPFAKIPDQSKLFLDFQADDPKLRSFYPNVPDDRITFDSAVRSALQNYPQYRQTVADILYRSNSGIAGEATLEAIEKFRGNNTVAVITGQQTGLYTGPLYTIYKALTAIKLAKVLSDNGTPAVAMFWAATEDHDFDEISHAETLFQSDTIASLNITRPASEYGKPVGRTLLDRSVTTANDELAELLRSLPQNEKVTQTIWETWRTDETIGHAFTRHLADIFRDLPLIYIDASSKELKKLAAPLVLRSIERADEISSKLLARTSELESKGYAPQVLIEKGHIPFFLLTEDGKRSQLRLNDDGQFLSREDGRKYTTQELKEILESAPERFSPGVMLRPVVQDILFPAACYVGGAAEISYFAQLTAVNEVLERPITPIIHRQSITLIESKHRRTMDRYDISFTDILTKKEKLISSVAEHVAPREVADSFALADEIINQQLAKLEDDLKKIDPTLIDSLLRRRKRIAYHIRELQKKAAIASLRNIDDAERRLSSLSVEIYPNEKLQERIFNISLYLSRHGEQLIEILLESIDVTDRGHRVVYL